MNNEITRLVTQYGDDVLRIASIILRSKDLAEDVYQETFLRAVRSFANFRKESSEKTWLISIAVNICRDYMRSAWKRRVIVTEDFPTYSDDKTTEGIVEKRIQRQQVIKAVMDLPDKYRKIVLLYYYQELGIKEIANILKMPNGTVKSRLFKARSLLSNMLGGEIYD